MIFIGKIRKLKFKKNQNNMGNFIKVFDTDAQYQSYIGGTNAVLPNASYVRETNECYFKPYVPPIYLCDIAYWNGSKVKTVSQDKWNTSLGTPVGVVVIPSGFTPDGRARMISLKYATSAGTSSDSGVGMAWGPISTDTPLTNYTKMPITDNAGSTSTGSDAWGCLPSDEFTGATSFVDSTAKYYGSFNPIPSPYLGDNKTFNPEYSKEILSGDTNVNALSDFNGLSNTEVLVGLGTDYTAANAAHNYNGGVDGTDIQWYLPAAGELGFLMPRFKTINAAITAVGGVAIAEGLHHFWSSTEESYARAQYVDTYGTVCSIGKNETYYARPFALL
jgi:hypothetical protein